jgi:phosphoribosylanthranilate isomerase
MKIKICGMTRRDDALYAAELGADALGFIFVQSSPRLISPHAARKIIQELPPFITPVGVFADMAYNDIMEIIDQTGICCVQLHGNETPRQLVKFPLPVYKSFHVDASFNPGILRRYKGPAYLLDTKKPGTPGGSGRTFDWDIAVRAKKYGRIILAGGLTPENILAAVQFVRPYAVDVNSGVEKSPGKKDRTKMKLLFKRLKMSDTSHEVL